MMRSSNAAQPRSWNTFRIVGAYDPLRPRIGRRLTIVGTPASLPWRAAAASIRLPITEPMMDTMRASMRERPETTRRGLASGHRPVAFAVSLIEARSEEHTSELQSLTNLVCRLLLEKK